MSWPRWARYADETPIFNQLYRERGAGLSQAAMASFNLENCYLMQPTESFMQHHWHGKPYLPPGAYR